MNLVKNLLGGTAAIAMTTTAATAQDASVKIGDLTWTGRAPLAT